ncbi:hypothetical protein [Paenibacillus endoradicis]|uniref:hypothetical protein n=1 Tax=Paenibacillus endoradicis TaxID=2972487 RepID=UPI002159A27E|nr:hypothetical protein [Paenibacillus endoradicis]MCR8656451.1 hypothetical protein [Paenibacillus endoradicis]
MYKNKIMFLSIVLTFSLLTACGTSNNTAADDNHTAGHVATQNDSNAAEHSGHATTKQTESHLQASFSFDTNQTKANEETTLTIQINDHDGQPVNNFELNHEKLLHLIMVNEDLSYFNHIHPEFVGDGKFTINTTFPVGGEYKLFADFIPSGGSSTTLSERIQVEGKEKIPVAITADKKLVTEVDGKEITLSLSGTKPNEEVTLTFNIVDANSKHGIDNLEQYLGAVGHVVILSADAEQYIHVHPLDEKSTGPIAEFATSFPTSGTYKLWGQFQQDGEVFTVPFVVDVK